MFSFCLFFTEQPGSALNLRYILDWAWNKVVQTKEELDGICKFTFAYTELLMEMYAFNI